MINNLSLSAIERSLKIWVMKSEAKAKAKVTCPECKSEVNHSERVGEGKVAIVCNDCGEVIKVH